MLEDLYNDLDFIEIEARKIKILTHVDSPQIQESLDSIIKKSSVIKRAVSRLVTSEHLGEEEKTEKNHDINGAFDRKGRQNAI